MRTIRKRFGWGIVSFAVALVFVASAIPVCSIGHAQSATDGKEKGLRGFHTVPSRCSFSASTIFMVS